MTARTVFLAGPADRFRRSADRIKEVDTVGQKGDDLT